jgi:hypothetical protein
MGRRLTRRAAAQALAGKDSHAAKSAQRWLRGRGVAVRIDVLGRRSLADCIDAIAWCRNRRPLSVRPAWLAALLQSGRARLVSGVCAVCGCSDYDPCPLGCGWTNQAETLCTACDYGPAGNALWPAGLFFEAHE